MTLAPARIEQDTTTSASSMTMDSQDGLSWAKGTFDDILLNWTTEPSLEIIEKVVRRELCLPDDQQCTVEFLAQGSFKKVYTVQYPSREDLIMCGTLLVLPRFKTMSEHATMKYM